MIGREVLATPYPALNAETAALAIEIP